jgi:hypothetical protein
MQGCGLGLATLSLLTAERTTFDHGDRVLTAYGASYGAFLGGMSPLLWHAEGEDAGRDIGLGVLLGTGVGMLAWGAAAQLTDYDLGDVGEIAFGTVSSSTLGAGIGLLAAPDTDLWVGLMEATGVAGSVAIAAVAEGTRFSSSDAMLAALATVYGLYQGAGLSLLVDASNEQVAGAMMTVGATGALVGSYFGRYLQLNSTDIWMLAAGSAWGVWIGIWSAAAIDRLGGGKQENPFFLGVGTTALATDATITLTAVAISELVKMPPEQFAWVSVAGGIGLVGGLLGSYLSGGEAFSPHLGIAAGSAGGLVLGAVITAFFDWDQPVYGDLAPALDDGGRGLGFLPEVAWWFPSVAAAPVGDAEGLAPRRGTQVLFTVTGGLN